MAAPCPPHARQGQTTARKCYWGAYCNTTDVKDWLSALDDLARWLAEAQTATDNAAALGALVPWKLRLDMTRKRIDASWIIREDHEISDLVDLYLDGCKIAAMMAGHEALPPTPDGYSEAKKAAEEAGKGLEDAQGILWGIAAIGGGIAAIILVSRLPLLGKGKARKR